MSKGLSEAIGVLKSKDIALIRRALRMTLPEGSTGLEIEFRATTLVNLFQGGLRSEGELIAAMTGDSPPLDLH